MRKLDLSNVQEFKSFRQPVGGFVIEIKSVEDVAEKEYLKLRYDIVGAYEEADKEFVGMYTKRKAERNFEFPFTIVSYKESALSIFKGFCTAIAESNNGYDFTKTFNEAELVGKVFGVVLGEEEYEGKDKNGAPKVRVRSTVVARRSVAKIMAGDFEVPELKKLDHNVASAPTNPFAQASAPATPVANPFGGQPINNPFDDEEVPF